VRRLALLVVVLALVAGCSRGDDDNIATAGASSTIDDPGSTVAGETTTAGAGDTGVASGSTPKGTAGAVATTAPAPTAPPPPAPAGAKFTPPGKYTYKVTGTQGAQKVDYTSTATIDPPNGADQHSSQTTLQGPMDQTLRHQPDGVYLVLLRQSTSFVNKEFRFDPPALTLPLPPTAGKAWSWKATSTDGKTTVDSAFTIVRTETIKVGGESVDAVVLEAKVTTSGDVNSTSTQTVWVSEPLRLILRADAKGRSTLGEFDTSSRLQSTKPA
jgi:hypothetical protein